MDSFKSFFFEFNVMKNGVDFKELKEIEKRILKGINLNDSFSSVKTIGAFDIAYLGDKYNCVAVVMNIESKEEIETKTVSGDEIIPYSPNLVAFREGPAVIEAYRSLENKPDILIVKGEGVVKPNLLGLASYVGVILNKPCIGVAKELIHGRLDEDRIIYNEDLKGYGVKTKQFANPVYVTPGHNISIGSAVEIIKKLNIEPYKLPLPLHLAHKYVNKLKKPKLVED